MRRNTLVDRERTGVMYIAYCAAPVDLVKTIKAIAGETRVAGSITSF
jgi:hypothetical protein